MLFILASRDANKFNKPSIGHNKHSLFLLRFVCVRRLFGKFLYRMCLARLILNVLVCLVVFNFFCSYYIHVYACNIMNVHELVTMTRALPYEFEIYSNRSQTCSVPFT